MKTPDGNTIAILGEKGRDLDRATVERLRRTALAYLAAQERGVAEEDLPDLWTGDGHLIPTRSTDETHTFTYIPAEY